MRRFAIDLSSGRRWVIGLLALGLALAPQSPGHHASHSYPLPRPASTAVAAAAWFPGYAPNLIRQAYGVDQLRQTGAGQVIAIVSASGASSLGADLRVFDETFHLPPMNGEGASACTIARGPHPCFERVYTDGQPEYLEDWANESALGVEWAHAIAPGADILLVEVPRATFTEMLRGVDVAARQASIVVMSWGSVEFPNERKLDAHFTRPGVTFLAATGDLGGGPLYPAASPYVIAVGGTTLSLGPNGQRERETTWIGSGFGESQFEPRPGYQQPKAGGQRQTPDVVYSANPDFGYPVYNSESRYTHHGWLRLGGTSAAVPQWAALIALANQSRDGPRLTSTNLAQSPLYQVADGDAAAFRAVPRYGDSGPTSGLGAPRADKLVPALAGLGTRRPSQH